MNTVLNDNIKISIPPIYYYSSPILQTSYKCLSSRSEHKLIYFTPFCPIGQNNDFNNKINNKMFRIEEIQTKNISNSKTSIIKSSYKLDNQSKPKKVVSFSLSKKESQLNEEKNKTETTKPKIPESISTDILNKNYDELIEKLKNSPSFKKLKSENKIKLFQQSKKSFKSKSISNEFNISSIKKEINNKIKDIKKEDINSINLCKSKSIDLRGNTINVVTLLSHAEEKVKNLTNTETISDFYEYTEKCMSMILDLDISKQKKIEEKVNFNFPIEEKKKKIALFDLDETLVHCIGEITKVNKKYQNIVEVTLPSKKIVKIGINIRPFWKEALDLIKDKYNIVIFTASHQSYADAVLNFMDPEKKYSKYRLYRNNCILNDVDGVKFYVKDLGIFDKYYNLKDIILVDNSVLSFAYHLDNGIPIVPYYDADEDGELEILGYYLLSIYEYDDLRKANQKHIRIEYYLEQARKEREEEDEIKEDDLSEEDETNDTNNTTNTNNTNKNSSKDEINFIYKKNIDVKKNENENKDNNNDNVNNFNKTVSSKCIRFSISDDETKLSFEQKSDDERKEQLAKKKYDRRKRNFSRKKTCACLDVRKMWGDMKREFTIKKSIN